MLLALVDCPPEKGTRALPDGWHMLPPLDRYVHRAAGVDMVDDNPRLLDRFKVSSPLACAAALQRCTTRRRLTLVQQTKHTTVQS